MSSSDQGRTANPIAQPAVPVNNPTRRAVLGAFAGVGSMLAAGSVLGIGPFGARPAAAATPGTGTGG